MKKLLIFAIALVTLSGCHESIEDRAARETKEYTEKNCPTPTVNYTRMDSITFDKASRTMNYYYTLCDKADNPKIIDKQRDELRKTLLKSLKASTQLKVYKQAGFNIKYVYHSEKSPNAILFKAEFTKKDYL